jgi:YQGE family putative transporter
MNAFIWRSSRDFASVALYNMGTWVTLPFVFFINGILLQYLSISVLYVLGLILVALVPFIVIMLSIKGLTSLFFVGIMFGIGWGFYWSNRNLYSLRLTEDSNRNYFYSLNYTLDIFTNILVPFLIGWLIVFGNGYAYQVLAIFLFLIYVTAGIVALPLSMHPSEHVHGVITKIKGRWNIVRLAAYGFGMQSGSNYVVPSLLVLFLLGNEGVLGTISSLGALVSALAIYQIGKVSLVHHRVPIFASGVLMIIATALFFTVYPVGVGIIAYVVGTSVAANFTWSAYSPILAGVIDQYTPTKKQNRFKYFVDHEFFLNLGRISGVGIFFILYAASSQFSALHFTPVSIAVIQLFVFHLVRKLV